MANEIIRGKLLSQDGQLTLVVLALAPEVAEGNELGAAVDDIHKTVDADLGGSGLTAELSGVPVMQLEIRQAVEHDRLVYNTVGFSRRLSHRDPFLPACIFHDHGGRTAIDRHSIGARRAGLAWFSP